MRRIDMHPRHRRTPWQARHPSIRRAAVAVTATVALVGGGAYAIAASTTAHATCTGSPALTQTTGGQKFSVTCTVPNPPASTVTETVTATPSPSPTDTPTPTPTPSVTPSPTPSETPTPTPTPSVSPTPTPTPTPVTGALYQPGSYLYSSPGVIDAAKTAAMRSFLGSVGAVYPKINGLGSNTWGMVFAVGHASDPTWHLIGSVDPRLGPNGPGFHAPANLGQRITGTSDSPMVVDDEADGITVAAQKVVKAPLCTTSSCTLNVGPGDYFTHGSNGLDTARHESNCGHCKAGRGRIPDSMLIRADYFTQALNTGTGLGHVLEMFWPETDSAAGFKLPMTGAEGSQVGWGAEGQRVAIDPSIDLGARPGCTREALVIARTLQQNGAYIGDNAGGNAWIIKAEQNSPADPVSAGAFASLSQTELAGCISASDFVAVGDGAFN